LTDAAHVPPHAVPQASGTCVGGGTIVAASADCGLEIVHIGVHVSVHADGEARTVADNGDTVPRALSKRARARFRMEICKQFVPTAVAASQQYSRLARVRTEALIATEEDDPLKVAAFHGGLHIYLPGERAVPQDKVLGRVEA
jgi:hypothetical protein